MTEFKGPIVEGAYYLRGGMVVGPAQQCESGTWWIGGHLYRDQDNGEHCAHPSKRLTRRVYITHADPAEVVAELRQLETGIRFRAGASEDGGEYGGALANGVREAADLVESMLGLARCGEDCNGNCELTAHGPTKAEAEVAELRSKATEVVAELRRMAESEWHADEPAQVVLTQAADLVAEKLVGGK